MCFELPTHLAHAIAAQIHRDTKAMARAKIPPTKILDYKKRLLYLSISDKSNFGQMSQFGEKIKQLREQKNLLQRQVAHRLEIDTPMLSKIERGERRAKKEQGERRAKKEQVLLFANIFLVSQAELLSLWLADQVYEVVKDERVALKAIHVAEEEIKFQSKKNR